MSNSKLPVIGVIILNTEFPRFAGDIGNPDSFAKLGFGSVYERVPVATVAKVVTGDGIDQVVAEQLLAAATRLGEADVDLVLTSCGYLGELQPELQKATKVPVVASSLTLLDFLGSVHGAETAIGVMTFDARRLKPHHLQMQSPGASVIEEKRKVVIRGMESSPGFYSMIAEDQPEADFDLLKQEVIEVASTFQQSGIAALILECTNLSPFKNEIREAAGVPVFDILDVCSFLLRT